MIEIKSLGLKRDVGEKETEMIDGGTEVIFDWPDKTAQLQVSSSRARWLLYRRAMG